MIDVHHFYDQKRSCLQFLIHLLLVFALFFVFLSAIFPQRVTFLYDLPFVAVFFRSAFASSVHFSLLSPVCCHYYFSQQLLSVMSDLGCWPHIFLWSLFRFLPRTSCLLSDVNFIFWFPFFSLIINLLSQKWIRAETSNCTSNSEVEAGGIFYEKKR